MNGRLARGRLRTAVIVAAALIVFGHQVGRAQSQIVHSVDVPLGQAFQVLGIIAERDVMLLNLPGGATVQMPKEVDDWAALMTVMADVHGLAWCYVGWNIVIGPAGKVCADNEAVNESVAAIVDDQTAGRSAAAAGTSQAGSDDFPGNPDAQPEALGLRLRVVQIDERRATELGINWRGGVFGTASALVAGGALIAEGVFPLGVFDEIISFLETEGVALRLEDVTLGGVLGIPVAFNRGGSINVSLARETSIERSYQYGLGLTVTPVRAGETILLQYTFDDSAPSVQSAELIQLAATTSSGSVLAGCGETVVLASSVSWRDEGEGSGLPVLASIPGAGYFAGQGSDRVTLGSFVVSLEPICAA